MAYFNIPDWHVQTTATLEYRDAEGEILPAANGVPLWSINHPEFITVHVDKDGCSAEICPIGPDGVTTLSVVHGSSMGSIDLIVGNGAGSISHPRPEGPYLNIVMGLPRVPSHFDEPAVNVANTVMANTTENAAGTFYNVFIAHTADELDSNTSNVEVVAPKAAKPFVPPVKSPVSQVKPAARIAPLLPPVPPKPVAPVAPVVHQEVEAPGILHIKGEVEGDIVLKK